MKRDIGLTNGQETELTTGSIDGPNAAASAQTAIDQEEIAKLAHRYWLERANDDATAEDDWFRAEQELKRRSSLAE
jgi:hypothetical protein